MFDFSFDIIHTFCLVCYAWSHGGTPTLSYPYCYWCMYENIGKFF